MSGKIRWLAVLVVLALALTACGGNTPAESAPMEAATTEMAQDEMMEEMPEATEAMMEEMPEATEAMMEETSHAGDTMMEETPMAEEAMMETPAFFKVGLTDAATGETFSIQDFEGKVVLVETLAMWCSTCMRQQQQVVMLHARLGERDDLVTVGLDIDPNEVQEDLTEYVASNGFGWYYAIAPIEVSREISQLYGDQFLNPPSAPMFIIDRHGEGHPLPFGLKSADDLEQALEPFLSQ